MPQKIILPQKRCQYCNRVISMKKPRDIQKRFCNRSCSAKYLFAKPLVVCPVCQKLMKHNRKHCSRECYAKSRKIVHIRTCQFCNKSFILKNIADERRGKGKYCSQKCFFNAVKKYTCNENFFNKIDNSTKAYWLGFLYADGYNSNYELIINLSYKDKIHLENFKQAIKSNHPIRKNNPKFHHGHDIASFRISSSKLCKSLSKIGCYKNKSLSITFPNFLKPKLYSYFIRGIFDGDGCIYTYKRGNQIVGKITIYSGSPSFIEGLKKHFDKNDINYRMERQGRMINICRKLEIHKFYKYIYRNNKICLERKKNKFKELAYSG